MILPHQKCPTGITTSLTAERGILMSNLLAILVVWLSILSASSGWTHDGMHVMGTVTAIDANHLAVKTPQGEVVSIMLTDKTEYASKNTPPTPKPRVGDRVVIDVVKDGLRALGMEFSTPAEKPKSSK
jgi:hypothetical protein